MTLEKWKKKSDRSYLWEHPFGKRYVPQETKMLQTRSPSFTDDCGHSLQGRPVSPPHKWHLSRRCAETSRQWPTRQAVWAFGHPFGNIKNHNTEKKNLTWDHTMLHFKTCFFTSTTQTYRAALSLGCRVIFSRQRVTAPIYWCNKVVSSRIFQHNIEHSVPALKFTYEPP